MQIGSFRFKNIVYKNNLITRFKAQTFSKLVIENRFELRTINYF